MAEAVHARENGENFSQVRNVLHFNCESLKSYMEAMFYFIFSFCIFLGRYFRICAFVVVFLGFKFPK